MPRGLYLLSLIALALALYVPLYMDFVKLPFIPPELERITVLAVRHHQRFQRKRALKGTRAGTCKLSGLKHPLQLPMAAVALAGVLFLADIAGTIAFDKGSEKERQALLKVRVSKAPVHASAAGEPAVSHHPV